MYKVFFKDRIVFLTDNIDRDLSDNFGAIFKYSNSKELFDFIDNFIQREEIQNAFIYHHDVEVLYTVFCNYFKFIEAAGGLVFNNENRILFINRLNKWDLPKGKAEKGESIDETALREVEEECGISNLKITKPLVSTYHTYPLKNKIVLKKTYWYRMEYSGNEDLVPQLEEDIQEAVWLNHDELEKVYENTYPSILEILKTEIK